MITNESNKYSLRCYAWHLFSYISFYCYHLFISCPSQCHFPCSCMFNKMCSFLSSVFGHRRESACHSDHIFGLTSIILVYEWEWTHALVFSYYSQRNIISHHIHLLCVPYEFTNQCIFCVPMLVVVTNKIKLGVEVSSWEDDDMLKTQWELTTTNRLISSGVL